MKTTQLLLAIFVSVALIGLVTKADAAIILSEDFEDFATGNHAVSEYGWLAVQRNGTQRSNSTVTPTRVFRGGLATGIGGGFPGGSARAVFGENVGDHFFVWKEGLRFQNPETVQLDVRTLANEPGEGYRLAFRIAGRWFIQNGLQSDPGDVVVTQTLDITAMDFFEWTTAPADDSSTFTTPGFPGGSPLSEGTVDAFGILAFSSFFQETFEFDNLTIDANPIPEPSTGLLLGFGLFGLVGRGGRWRVEGDALARTNNQSPKLFIRVSSVSIRGSYSVVLVI